MRASWPSSDGRSVTGKSGEPVPLAVSGTPGVLPDSYDASWDLGVGRAARSRGRIFAEARAARRMAATGEMRTSPRSLVIGASPSPMSPPAGQAAPFAVMPSPDILAVITRVCRSATSWKLDCQRHRRRRRDRGDRTDPARRPGDEGEQFGRTVNTGLVKMLIDLPPARGPHRVPAVSRGRSPHGITIIMRWPGSFDRPPDSTC